MTARDTYNNKALDAVCEAIEEWDLTPEQAKSLVADILQELEAREEGRNEAAWEAHQARLMETGGPDDSSYRRQMKDAGRGHLLR